MSNIATLVDSYTPNADSIKLLQSGPLVLVAGITGAGKDTILNAIVQTGAFHDLITTITREPRYNNGVLERDGVEYYFIDESRAMELLAEGRYLEVSLVHGRVYGVTVDEVRRAHEAGRVAIADVDVQGVEKFKKLSPNVTAIFLVPPSYEEWQKRVSKRYPSQEAFLADWPNRRQSAVAELERALSASYYHFVVNDELARAIDSCIKITRMKDQFVRKDDEARMIVRDLLAQIKASE